MKTKLFKIHLLSLIILNILIIHISAENKNEIRITKYEGNIKIKCDTEEEFILLKQNIRRLNYNQTIKLDEEAVLMLTIDDRLNLLFNGPGEFVIEDTVRQRNPLLFQSKQITLNLKNGSVSGQLSQYQTGNNPLRNLASLPNRMIDLPRNYLNIPTDAVTRHLRDDFNFKVQTPQLVCGVRGTVFNITTFDDNDAVNIYEGKAEVIDKNSEQVINVEALRKIIIDKTATEHTPILMEQSDIVDDLLKLKNILDRENVLVIVTYARNYYPDIINEIQTRINQLQLRQEELYKFTFGNVRIISIDFGGIILGVPSNSYEVTINEKFSIENTIYYYNNGDNNWNWNGTGFGIQIKYYMRKTSPLGGWLSIIGSYGRLGYIYDKNHAIISNASIRSYGIGFGHKSVIADRWYIEPFIQRIKFETLINDNNNFPLDQTKTNGGIKIGFRF